MTTIIERVVVIRPPPARLRKEQRKDHEREDHERRGGSLESSGGRTMYDVRIIIMNGNIMIIRTTPPRLRKEKREEERGRITRGGGSLESSGGRMIIMCVPHYHDCSYAPLAPGKVRAKTTAHARRDTTSLFASQP